MRGNDRAKVFHDNDDRSRFLRLVAQEVIQGSLRLHHYVLMDNHVHMIVRLGPDHTLSAPLKRINQAYSEHHARRYGRTGHLWEGRFKSFFIDNDAYLLTCGIYIALNPVRAGMISSPESYTWSSHRAYVTTRRDPLIEHDPAYLGLAISPAARRKAYRALTLSWEERDMTPLDAERFFSNGPADTSPPD
jgi:putative transposase